MAGNAAAVAPAFLRADFGFAVTAAGVDAGFAAGTGAAALLFLAAGLAVGLTAGVAFVLAAGLTAAFSTGSATALETGFAAAGFVASGLVADFSVGFVAGFAAGLVLCLPTALTNGFMGILAAGEEVALTAATAFLTAGGASGTAVMGAFALCFAALEGGFEMAMTLEGGCDFLLMKDPESK
ncbi:hypothetical protein [Lacisediminimonas sp.]|uniref:hypothetical protein n=1 Tax=Lacisediminimonas sp. TaxID=3060582 RepID=UPI00272B6DB4|nr:hypothetical protein [Lacisediminimonas sp.]